jgi:hypothetical protein
MGISDSLGLYDVSHIPLGPPTFMCYLGATRNIILLRVSNKVHFAVASLIIADFSKSERLADTSGVTKLN